jgi:C4-dicarboxylate-binding protein DctP
MNDRFYSKTLTPEQQAVVADAAKILAANHNGFSQEANIKGVEALKAKGMEVYKPTAEELGQFRSQAQPAALEFINEKIGKDWVDSALTDAAVAEKKVGDRADQIIADTIQTANDMLKALP